MATHLIARTAVWLPISALAFAIACSSSDSGDDTASAGGTAGSPGSGATAGSGSVGSQSGGTGGGSGGGVAGGPPTPLPWSGDIELVFTSRTIPKNGTPYYAAANGMPGQGPFSRFQAAVPGKLQVREKDGKIRTLVDGATPNAVSLDLVDVNAPEVSYDGKRIVFAGLPSGNYKASQPRQEPGAWRLYAINVDGTGLVQLTHSELIYDNPGTTELRARLIRPRAVPFVIQDQVTGVASELPPTAAGPYDTDGTFKFNALNVYFNAPVDVDIVSAPAVGSAGTIRAFIDHERGSLSSANWKDWPILLEEKAVAADGSVQLNAPANVPLFEQLRTPKAQGCKVPLSPGNYNPPYDPPPAAHVAGHNWERPGADARCVGCHAGHGMIPVPADPQAYIYTNLAPGADVSASSGDPRGLVDRRVRSGSGEGR